MTTIHEKIKKVFNGGDSSPLVHLNTKQADTFIDYMKDETVLLKKFRTKKMTTPIETVAKIGIGEKVLYPADRTGQPSRETKADPSSIELNVKKFRAMVSFGDDELEDNIEGMSFKEHMMRMVGKAAGNQIEHAALYARFIGASPSIANVVDIENQWSGIFEQAGIVLDASSAKFSDRFIDKIKLTTLRKQFKTKYRQDMEIFMSDGIRQDYVDKYSALSGWNTVDQESAFGKKYQTVWLMNEDSTFVPVGGASTTAAVVTKGTNTITVDSASGFVVGMEIVVNYGLPTEFRTSITNIATKTFTLEDIIPYELTSATVRECVSDGAETLMMNPRNVIWGILRDFTVEYERDAEHERNNFYVSIRSDLKVENAEAIGFIKNLQSR